MSIGPAENYQKRSMMVAMWIPTGRPSSPQTVVFLVKADGVERRFGAHRQFLAGISPVFRAWFYGPMKETERAVEVKDATPAAFGTMIDYIYRAPDSDFSLEDINQSI